MKKIACQLVFGLPSAFCIAWPATAALSETEPVRHFTFEQRAGQRLIREGATVRRAAQLTAPALGHLSARHIQMLTLDFYADNYFSAGNVGHFAIGVRGDALRDVNNDGQVDIRGRGVVIGNVTAYPAQPGHEHCRPTSALNTVAIESFWVAGNCVHGGEPPAERQVTLRDGTWYRLRLSVGQDCRTGPLRIGYHLFAEKRGKWVRIGSAEVDDDSRNSSPINLDGWFIGEVFSTHDWRFKVRNWRVSTRVAQLPVCKS